MIIYLQMLETPEEKSKFEQLYLEYKGLMFHVAYEILHNEQDAEDAVHQAFVKIAENIKKIDDPRYMYYYSNGTLNPFTLSYLYGNDWTIYGYEIDEAF